MKRDSAFGTEGTNELTLGQNDHLGLSKWNDRAAQRTRVPQRNVAELHRGQIRLEGR